MFKSAEHAAHSMILRKKKMPSSPLKCILMKIKVIFMVDLSKGSENTEDGLDIVF